MTWVSVIDLFAGAGGLSLGAQMAGAQVRAAVDNDAHACETLRVNPQHDACTVVEGDVSGLAGDDLREAAGLEPGEPVIVVGGAPCQPFSKAAYWLDPGGEARYRQARAQGKRVRRPSPPSVRADERRTLVGEYWRLVIETDAQGFVFENVPSILHPRNRGVLEAIEDAARAEGFVLTRVIANAAEYGVPQRRKRVLLLGAKGRTPVFAEPTHAVGSPVAGRKPAATAGEALDPFAGAEFSEPQEVVEGRWAAHLREIPPGWNYKWHTAWAGHPSPAFEAERRFWNFLLKLSPNAPSWTLPASPGPWVGPFHWDSRRLRTVEMAALQGFPAGYTFCGPRRERVRQVGNAVPPPLAEAAVRAVIEALA